jgi:hypothetical protein
MCVWVWRLFMYASKLYVEMFYLSPAARTQVYWNPLWTTKYGFSSSLTLWVACPVSKGQRVPWELKSCTSQNTPCNNVVVILFVKGIVLINNFSVSVFLCCGQGIWYEVGRCPQQSQALRFVFHPRHVIPFRLNSASSLVISFSYASRGRPIFWSRTWYKQSITFYRKPLTFLNICPLLVHSSKPDDCVYSDSQEKRYKTAGH